MQLAKGSRLVATQSTAVDRPREDTNRVVQVEIPSAMGCFYATVSLQCGGRVVWREQAATNLPQELERWHCCEFANIDSTRHGGVAQVVRAWDS